MTIKEIEEQLQIIKFAIKNLKRKVEMSTYENICSKLYRKNMLRKLSKTLKILEKE